VLLELLLLDLGGELLGGQLRHLGRGEGIRPGGSERGDGGGGGKNPRAADWLAQWGSWGSGALRL
jgi:hypothetical protein